jgi:hypothetical protein
MPQSALDCGEVDHFRALEEIPALMTTLVAKRAPDEKASPVPKQLEEEVRSSEAGVR